MSTQDKPRYARNPVIQRVPGYAPNPVIQWVSRVLYFVLALGSALALGYVALAVPALGVLLVVFFVIYFAVKAGTRAGRKG